MFVVRARAHRGHTPGRVVLASKVTNVPTGLSPFNRALNLISRRAEKRQAAQLRETFVDAGIATVLESVDHQVLYGRRGAGKTRALRYVESQVKNQGDIGVY